MPRLAGKVAIVTGAARGIGLAIAKRFVAEGAKVVLADIDERAGNLEAKRLGASARFVACDVGDAGEVTRMVESARAAFTGDVDILVNNAGIVHGADFLSLKEDDFDRVLRTNLKGAFLCSQAVARRMVEQIKAGKPAGTIINMSSINAVLAIADQVPYCVTKGGIGQLTRSISLALAPHGIRVNAIGPGSVMTEMLAKVAKDREAKRRMMSRTPLGRFAEPDEVASIAVFLASDDASYITGETIYADGGRLALNYTVPVAE
jgi:NAD(P)-dependent dehydrogenase (short-subunit alcohol dehydrogenase family)